MKLEIPHVYGEVIVESVGDRKARVSLAVDDEEYTGLIFSESELRQLEYAIGTIRQYLLAEDGESN